MDLSVTGVVSSDLAEEPQNAYLLRPCGHDWISYHGISGDMKVCGICGRKHQEDSVS